MSLLSNLGISSFCNTWNCQVKDLPWHSLFLKLFHYSNQIVFFLGIPLSNLRWLLSKASLFLRIWCKTHFSWSLLLIVAVNIRNIFLRQEIHFFSPCCCMALIIGSASHTPLSMLTQDFENSSLSSIHHYLEEGIDNV